MFDDYAFNNIRDVLTAVYCRFEFLVNFLPFQYSQRIVGVVK